MEQRLSIHLPSGVKATVAIETAQAIRRACRVYACDRRVLNYAAAAHEGITVEIVAAIRRRMISNGQLTRASWSRRGEIAMDASGG